MQSERTILDFFGRGTESVHPMSYYSVLLTCEGISVAPATR